ncbi:DUF5672 family protein [Flavobacterium sp. TMP13]|uniref:DUF5672 family protein n=1 Tax=Flavobacterium sp. TMP13 TaxID=3425950 RepID=UPI003D7742BA
MKETVKILIPIYKDHFGELEEKSFLQCVKLLGEYGIILIQPEGLDNSYITSKYPEIEVVSYPKKHFESIEGYNKLLMTSTFYESFLNYDYILIYQLDAFVFRDDLKKWCQKGYDYIGAPWIATPINSFGMKVFTKIARNFRSKKKNNREQTFYKVGNGGFSLRKVKSHYNIALANSELISELLNAGKNEICGIEDVFWSLKAPLLDSNFRIPDYKEALYFAIDRKPEIAFSIINREMPFGCHGINKPKVIDFWKPILDKY